MNKIKKYQLQPKLRNLFLLLVLIMTINLVYFFFFTADDYVINHAKLQREDFIMAFGSLCLTCCLLYCLYSIGKCYLEQEKLYSIHQQVGIFTSQIHDLSDMKKAYYQDILTQQQEMMKQLSHHEDKPFHHLESAVFQKNTFFSENEIIDTVLSSKYKIMKDHHIDFDCHVQLPQSLHIKDIDMATILFNLLDNAIAACLNMEKERKINFFMEEKKNMIFIQVKNTYQNQVIKTTRMGHGYGLKIIEDVMNLYQGEMEISKTHNEYQVSLCLYAKAGELND